MKLLRYIMRPYLYALYYSRKLTGTGSFGKKGAVYMDRHGETGDNAIKNALIRHHVKQFHESSCSVASVVSVINAIKAVEKSLVDPITQKQILDAVKTGHWKERMSPNGHNGRRGLPLPLLDKIVKSSLDVYGIDYEFVETVQTIKDPIQSNTLKQVLRSRLKRFETRGDCLIIAHFDQGAMVRTLNIPHISPVGGYNEKNGKVMVLDVDPDQEKSYQVPFDTFYKALSSDYNHVFRRYGYGSGGYVYIELNRF